MRKEKQLRKKVEPHITLRPRIGRALKEFRTNKIEYRHFDDFNEIIDRLRLLMSSQSAGNTNHNNEIISIIEELREGGIIE